MKAEINPAVLLVEDSDDDVFLLRRAFAKSGGAVALHVAQDGREALDYLSGAGRFGDRAAFPAPKLMLLDLKLPFFTGLEVLQWTRQHASWRGLPVVILTSSSQPTDIDHAYALGANSYLVKPSDVEQLVRLAAAVKHYWLELNQPGVPVRHEA